MTTLEDTRNQKLSFIEQNDLVLRDHRRGGDGGSDLIWNVLTLLVWLGIAGMIMAFISIYFNPASNLNLLRPFQPTLIAAVNLPSEAATLPVEAPVLPATMLPTEILTPQPPTATPTLEPTQTETPTPGPSPTATI
ncbi:MAG: hypothetical protein IH586_05510, partial [Anaerolineaceae bacterium]|nr:hypothetical protein [Anaerolineaceae bacterium]